MSFFIKTKSYNHEWHINNTKPYISDDIAVFQADGDELEFIRNRFNNIPITKGNHCVWKGEMADFIYHNINL